MSNSDSETDDYLDTKNKPNQPLSSKNVGYFVIYLFIWILLLTLYFGINGAVLYASKQAIAMIYGNKNTKNGKNVKIAVPLFPEEPTTNINVIFQLPFQDALMSAIKDYQSNIANANFVGMYFIEIFEKMANNNKEMMNFYLSHFTKNKTGSLLTTFLGGIGAGIGLLGLFLFDLFYLIYLWFTSMNWFFTRKVVKDNKASWKPVDMLFHLESYILGWLLVVAFSWLLLFVLILAWPVIPLLTLAWNVFGFLSTTSWLQQSPQKTIQSNVFTIIGEMFKMYKHYIAPTFAVLTLLITYANLGLLALCLAIASYFLVYYFIPT